MVNHDSPGLVITPVEADRPRPLYLLKRFLAINANCTKIYLPVHIVVLILRLRNSKHNKKTLLLKFVKELIGSCLFASCFAMSIPSSYCYLIDLIGFPRTSNIGMIIGFIFSWSIFLDSRSRWSEMSLYVLAQWFEGYTYSLYKRKLVPVVPHWEKLVFGVAMAIVSYAYFSRSQEEEKMKDNKIEMMLRFILGSHNFKV